MGLRTWKVCPDRHLRPFLALLLNPFSFLTPSRHLLTSVPHSEAKFLSFLFNFIAGLVHSNTQVTSEDGTGIWLSIDTDSGGNQLTVCSLNKYFTSRPSTEPCIAASTSKQPIIKVQEPLRSTQHSSRRKLTSSLHSHSISTSANFHCGSTTLQQYSLKWPAHDWLFNPILSSRRFHRRTSKVLVLIMKKCISAWMALVPCYSSSAEAEANIFPSLLRGCFERNQDNRSGQKKHDEELAVLQHESINIGFLKTGTTSSSSSSSF